METNNNKTLAPYNTAVRLSLRILFFFSNELLPFEFYLIIYSCVYSSKCAKKKKKEEIIIHAFTRLFLQKNTFPRN